MRVGEEADVEHQVRLARQAVAVGERDHGQGRPGALGDAEMACDQLPQPRRRELRGVDHEVGALAQRRDQPALAQDAVGDRAVRLERMAAAGLGEAALQDLVVAVEEQQAEVRAPLGELLAQSLRIEGAGPAVDADREVALDPVAGADQVGEQGRGQIVDRLEAEVLEDLQRGGAACAGHARHQHDPAHRRLR